VIAESVDDLDRKVSVDSSIVRAHQHAAGARKAVLARPHAGASGRRGRAGTLVARASSPPAAGSGGTRRDPGDEPQTLLVGT
jgi:hypothetical protein